MINPNYRPEPLKLDPKIAAMLIARQQQRTAKSCAEFMHEFFTRGCYRCSECKDMEKTPNGITFKCSKMRANMASFLRISCDQFNEVLDATQVDEILKRLMGLN